MKKIKSSATAPTTIAIQNATDVERGVSRTLHDLTRLAGHRRPLSAKTRSLCAERPATGITATTPICTSETKAKSTDEALRMKSPGFPTVKPRR
jgi:hypothetical protein